MRISDAEPLFILAPIRNALFLTGPTAGGKTKIGVSLAQKLNAEVVSLDSMAIYRKMDIGTAKPTQEERGGIPHHLIDIVEPWEEFSLADYLKAAHKTSEDIRSRGKTPLFVGGTPLYLKAALYGIFEGPPADPSFRAEQTERETIKPGTLHRELALIDPAAAERIHPNDTRRLIRGLEVFHKTGRPISAFQTQFKKDRPNVDNIVFALSWPREALYERINGRVDKMMAEGFLDEVRGLLSLDKPLSRTALQGVGYRELIDVIENKASLSESVEKIKQLTRNFAKRQETWFRSLSGMISIPVSDPIDPNSIRETVCETIASKTDSGQASPIR